MGEVKYNYDHRGRQIRAGSRLITYNIFDLPRNVQDGSSGSLYEYTAAGDRFRRTEALGTREAIYVDRLLRGHKDIGTGQMRYAAGEGLRAVALRGHKDIGTGQIAHVHHVVGPGSTTRPSRIRPAGVGE